MLDQGIDICWRSKITTLKNHEFVSTGLDIRSQSYVAQLY